ncbi:MAG: carboxypeptidase regulatory-like domain-containing protein [Anaerolineales bacterium]|nr:carboxypeptidase regulatory-like domain-containing protein [Anaerolineales bacterium]
MAGNMGNKRRLIWLLVCVVFLMGTAGLQSTVTWAQGGEQWFYLPIVLRNPGAVPETYRISGNILDTLGAPLEGVTVADGAGHTALTDANGDYHLGNLPAGSYTIAPTLGDYTFTPPTRAVTLPPDASGQDFLGEGSAPANERLVVFEAFFRYT